MTSKTQNLLKWLFFTGAILTIVFLLVSEVRRRDDNYSRWITTMCLLGGIDKSGGLNRVIKPEVAAKYAGSQATDATLLKMDWPLEESLILQIGGRPYFKATATHDGWGNCYYGVFDFNNDGLIPNPQTLTHSAGNAAPATLMRRTAIFSAGPAGDPATWKDNLKSW